MFFNRRVFLGVLCLWLLVSMRAYGTPSPIDYFALPSSEFGSYVADGQTAHHFNVSLKDATGQAPAGALVQVTAEPATGVSITPATFTVPSGQIDTPISVTSTSTGTKVITVQVTHDGSVIKATREVTFIAPLDTVELWPYGSPPPQVYANGQMTRQMLTALVTSDFEVPYGATVAFRAYPESAYIITPSRIDDYQGDTVVSVATTIPGNPNIYMDVIYGGKTYTTVGHPGTFLTPSTPTLLTTVDHPTIMADGLSRIKVTATLRHPDGSPYVGGDLAFFTNMTGVTANDWAAQTDQNGQASIYISKTTPGSGQVYATAYVSYGTVNGTQATVGFASGTPSVREFFYDGDVRGRWWPKYPSFWPVEIRAWEEVQDWTTLNDRRIATTGSNVIVFGPAEEDVLRSDSYMVNSSFNVMREVTWSFDAGSPSDKAIAGWYIQSQVAARASASGATQTDWTAMASGWGSATVSSPLVMEGSVPCVTSAIAGPNQVIPSDVPGPDQWIIFSTPDKAVPCPYNSVGVAYICIANAFASGTVDDQSEQAIGFGGAGFRLLGGSTVYIPVNPDPGPDPGPDPEP